MKNIISILLIAFILQSCSQKAPVTQNIPVVQEVSTERNGLKLKNKENQKILEDFYRFWETGDEKLLISSASKKLKDNDRNPQVEGTDYEAILGMGKMINAGLTEATHNFVGVYELENDKVIIRWEGTARHTGELFGISPTNRTLYFSGNDILQIKDGKITELWHIEELFQMFGQIQ